MKHARRLAVVQNHLRQRQQLRAGQEPERVDWTRLTTEEIRECRDIQRKIILVERGGPDIEPTFDFANVSDAELERLPILLTKLCGEDGSGPDPPRTRN